MLGYLPALPARHHTGITGDVPGQRAQHSEPARCAALGADRCGGGAVRAYGIMCKPELFIIITPQRSDQPRASNPNRRRPSERLGGPYLDRQTAHGEANLRGQPLGVAVAVGGAVRGRGGGRLSTLLLFLATLDLGRLAGLVFTVLLALLALLALLLRPFPHTRVLVSTSL
jgi:hypothetical protein